MSHAAPTTSTRSLTDGASRKLMRRMMATVERYELVAQGDRILVAVSGGKDSYTLLDLLWRAKQRSPVSFDLVAVHLDQTQPGYDGAPLAGFLEQLGAPFEILREDTYSVVKEGTRPGQAYCFLCARLRRGILYSAAERLGCNKLAFGHHRDDSLETLLMNLFYSGRLQAMPAQYTTDDKRFEVIRPLIECGEAEIAAYAEERAFPILPCNLCGSQEGLKREAMKELLRTLEASIPDVRTVMLQSLRNVRPSHLLDVDVKEAWMQRPEHLRPYRPALTEARNGASPVVAKGGSLPIVE
jgi:tRNA 2-thiocytidine biosynthesis protein TtcA